MKTSLSIKNQIRFSESEHTIASEWWPSSRCFQNSAKLEPLHYDPREIRSHLSASFFFKLISHFCHLFSFFFLSNCLFRGSCLQAQAHTWDPIHTCWWCVNAKLVFFSPIGDTGAWHIFYEPPGKTSPLDCQMLSFWTKKCLCRRYQRYYPK